MAISLDTFFKAAADIRSVGADKESSGDKTAVQFGSTGRMVAHDWETLGFREDKYKLENQRIRQAFYDALTSELGDLNKLPKAVRDELKIGDFLLDKDGKVTSQRPLTLRRIEAVDKAVKTYLKMLQDDPFSALKLTKPLTYSYSEAHLADIKASLKDDVKDTRDIMGATGDGTKTLRTMGNDIHRGLQLKFRDETFKPIAFKAANAGDDPDYKAHILEFLDKVFQKEDGTVDEPARNAFIRFGSQRLGGTLCEYVGNDPDNAEWPMIVSGDDRGMTFTLDRGEKPGTYRVHFTTEKCNINGLMNLKDGKRKNYSNKLDATVKNEFAMTFSVDRKGELVIHDVSKASCTLDFSRVPKAVPKAK